MVEGCLKELLGADVCNWSCLLNDFYKASEPDPHLHMHCRPRFRKPVPINGNEYTDEEFGHHYATHKKTQLQDADRESLFMTLKQRFGT